MSNKTPVKVSVIVPCYNAEAYIVTTLKSVLLQTFTNFEILVIDDGSKDGSGELIKKLAETDNRIFYYYKQNEGVSVARNLGMEKSRGDYLAFLDADDYWGEFNLEKKVGILDSKPDIDWVFSDAYVTDSELNNTGEILTGRDTDFLDNLLLWEGNVVPGGSNLVIRKKCYEQGCIYDPLMSTTADRDYCIQLAKKFKGYRIAEPLWKYRVLPFSMSRNVPAIEKDQLRMYKKASEEKLFSSFMFKLKCLSTNDLILAGCWWKNGHNKARALKFLLRAFFTFPPVVLKRLLKKLLRLN